MAGKGKYTTYNAPASNKKTFLEKLFKGSPFAGMDQSAAIDPKRQDSPVKLGNDHLRAALTDGIVDTGTLALGKVDLTYQGRENQTQQTPPDTHEGKDVKWAKAGDPANSYVPDVSSPGPGMTNGTDKTTDPEIKTTDVKPNFDPAKASTNTKSPSEAGPKVYEGSTLGKDRPMGTSGT